MYAVTISIRAIDEQHAPQLRQASIDVAAASRMEPGCLFFDVLFDSTDPLLVRFYEAYQDKDSYHAHFQTAHLKAWQQKCLPWIEKSSIRLPESVSNR